MGALETYWRTSNKTESMCVNEGNLLLTLFSLLTSLEWVKTMLSSICCSVFALRSLTKSIYIMDGEVEVTEHCKYKVYILTDLAVKSVHLVGLEDQSRCLQGEAQQVFF